MTEDEWLATYKPKKNHLDPNESHLFETYGDELNHVNSYPIHNIWTLMDGFWGNTLIVNGCHFVNRIGYYISEVPWKDGESHEILVNDVVIDAELHGAMDGIQEKFAPSSYDLGYHHAMSNIMQVLEAHESDEAIALEVQKLIQFYIDSHL